MRLKLSNRLIADSAGRRTTDQQGRVDALPRRTGWAPHAIRQNPYLSWREIDATTVEVSAESVGGPARARLMFENGDIVRIEADDRPRAVGSRMVPTRWRGRFFDYREIDGCRIPTRAVVSWLSDEGSFDCWRGKVTAFTIRHV